MTDIRDLLHRAAEPDSHWAVDRQALVAAGHRRVARRRLAVIACSVVVAATATIVGLTTMLGTGDQESLVVDHRREAGFYVEVSIPVAEVERRCSIVVNRQRGLDDQEVRWVAGEDSGGRGVSAADTSQDVENREGRTVTLVPEGARWPAGVGGSTRSGPGSGGGFGPRVDQSAECVIPQESMLDRLDTARHRDVPEPADHGAVLAQCSYRTGYDITSWSVLAAVDAFGDVEAIAMSANGYVVTCSIDPGGAQLTFDERRYLDDHGRPELPSDDEGPTDPDRYTPPVQTWGQGSDPGPVECRISGMLPGLPDDYQVAISLPGGDVVTTTTHRGAFAIAFETTRIPDRLPVAVSTADGDIVWEGRW